MASKEESYDKTVTKDKKVTTEKSCVMTKEQADELNKVGKQNGIEYKLTKKETKKEE